MAKRRKTGGRQKGVPNKAGAHAKENIARVFDLLGGVKALAAWAKDNRSEFYKLYARSPSWSPGTRESTSTASSTR